jgi:hypothetical protein
VEAGNATAACVSDWAAVNGCMVENPAMFVCSPSGDPLIDTQKRLAACSAQYDAVNRCTGCVLNPCKVDTDCPGDQLCNTAMGACFQQTASCPGLPCRVDTDCPQRLVCNTATQTCN